MRDGTVRIWQRSVTGKETRVFASKPYRGAFVAFMEDPTFGRVKSKVTLNFQEIFNAGDTTRATKHGPEAKSLGSKLDF